MQVFIVIRVPTGETPEAAALQDTAARVAGLVEQAGHTAFVAYQEIQRRGWKDGRDFMPFVRGHLRESGLLLLVYTPELRGGLIEAGMAYAWGVPVWLLQRRGERVSSSARGCAERVMEYASLDELAVRLGEALNEVRE